jgi:hypothetical protein
LDAACLAGSTRSNRSSASGMNSSPYASGGLAGHARVRQAARHGRRHLEVPGGLAAIAGQFRRVKAEAEPLPVQQGARFGARLAVHQPQSV